MNITLTQRAMCKQATHQRNSLWAHGSYQCTCARVQHVHTVMCLAMLRTLHHVHEVA